MKLHQEGVYQGGVDREVVKCISLKWIKGVIFYEAQEARRNVLHWNWWLEKQYI